MNRLFQISLIALAFIALSVFASDSDPLEHTLRNTVKSGITKIGYRFGSSRANQENKASTSTSTSSTSTAQFCLARGQKALTNQQIQQHSARARDHLLVDHKQHEKQSLEVRKDTSPQHVQQIYQLLKDIFDLCGAYHVTCWAEGGTLLGAVRDKGLIKWDDDGDVGVPVDEEINFQKIFPRLQSCGYGVKAWYYGYKVYRLDGSAIPDAACAGGVKPFKYPFIDVFMVDYKADGRTYFPRSNLWPNCYFFKNELFPLQTCTFGPMNIPCAGQPEPYLDRCYSDGGDWRVSGYHGKDHVTYGNEGEAPKPFSLTGQSNRVLPGSPLKEHVFA